MRKRDEELLVVTLGSGYGLLHLDDATGVAVLIAEALEDALGGVSLLWVSVLVLGQDLFDHRKLRPVRARARGRSTEHREPGRGASRGVRAVAGDGRELPQRDGHVAVPRLRTLADRGDEDAALAYWGS
jgi:hypothetical protein